MSEHLLQAVLALVDQIESAVVEHYSILHFPPDQPARLISEGILRQVADASEIPRPERFGPGPDLTVVRTAKGIEGVAGERDYFRPVQLTEEDIRQYDISLPNLVEAIRRDSGIEGKAYRNENGLILVGQKPVVDFGICEVYFSAPNGNQDSVMARCRRIMGIAGERRVVLLTPNCLDLSTEDRRILVSGGILTGSLMAAASEGHLRVTWNEVCVRFDAANPASGGSPVGGPDLERVIQTKVQVDVNLAARYLKRSVDHVRRLVREKKLRKLGEGRPIQISTASLRKYKGTEQPPSLTLYEKTQS